MREFFRGWKRNAGVTTLVVACAVLSISCAHQQTSRPTVIRTLTQEERWITTIAEEAVKAKGQFTGGLGADDPHKTDYGWSVDVWSLPKAPDGFVTVRLDNEGNVLGVSPL